MTRKIFLLLITLFITACSHTVGGLGRDLQDGGMAIQDGVSDIRQSLKI